MRSPLHMSNNTTANGRAGSASIILSANTPQSNAGKINSNNMLMGNNNNNAGNNTNRMQSDISEQHSAKIKQHESAGYSKTSSNMTSANTQLSTNTNESLSLPVKSINSEILLNLNKIGSNLPLSNLTSIRKSSIRNGKTYAKIDFNKSLLSSSLLTNVNHLGLLKQQQQQQREITDLSDATTMNAANEMALTQRDAGDHVANHHANMFSSAATAAAAALSSTATSKSHLLKIASSWKTKSPRVNEQSMISQIKIRQTQMMLHDEHDLSVGDSSLAKKIAELNEKFNRVNLIDDTSSDKCLKLDNKVKPHLVPLSRRYDDSTDSEDGTSSSAYEIIPFNNLNYWRNNHPMQSSLMHLQSNNNAGGGVDASNGGGGGGGGSNAHQAMIMKKAKKGMNMSMNMNMTSSHQKTTSLLEKANMNNKMTQLFIKT